MTINYSKVSAFLIIFFIWNIASTYFIDYEIDYSGMGGIELYTALWVVWFFASLLITILYLLDSRKNKKASALSPTISSGGRSRTADFLTSFILSIGSLILIHSVLFITTKGFTISKTPTYEQWFPETAGLEIFFFLLIWMPSYFYILRHSNKKKLKISLILAFSYLLLFASYMINGS